MSGLIFAVESAENELGADVTSEEVAALEATVADESTVIQAESNEADVTVSQVEAAVQEGEELEAIADVATDSLADGGEGLTEEAAEVAAIAIERARARLGFGDLSRITPAREQFGSSSTRQHATVMVVEGIKETVKKIWEAIKKAAIRLWDKIKSFVAGLFNSTDQLSKLILSLQDRVRKLPAAASMKEKTLDIPGIASKLTVKGKVDANAFKALADNTKKLKEIGAKLSEATITMNNDAIASFTKIAAGEHSELEKLIKGSESYAEMVSQTVGQALQKVPEWKTIGTVSKAGKKNADSNFYGPFAGNTVLRVSKYTLDTANKLVKSGTTSFSISFESNLKKESTKLTALTQGEMAEMLKTCRELVTTLADYKQQASKVEGVSKAIDKTASAVISAAGAGAEGAKAEVRLALQEAKSTVEEAMSIMRAVGVKAPALTFSLAKAGVDYVSASLRNMREYK